jgi:3-hydroxyisobutyrate dehydrogenase-like beta-hydroxyacid dehydrogenase
LFFNYKIILRVLCGLKKIAIVGAGIMGHGFAMVFAQKGYPVFLYDIDPRILKKDPGAGSSFNSTVKAFCSLGF